MKFLRTVGWLPLVMFALFPPAAFAQSPVYLLALGYELPVDANLRADANTKLAACLTQRVVADSACRAGDSACRRDAEIAFRTCLAGAGVPGAHFELAVCQQNVANSCQDVLPVTAREATDDGWNPALHQIPANTASGYYVFTGLTWLADQPCAFQQSSDGTAATFSDQDLVCQALHDVINSGGAPALLVAVGNQQDVLALYLLREGADPTQSNDGWHPVDLAARNGDLELLRPLFRASNIDDVELHELLWAAVASGDHDSVRFLLGRGGKPQTALRTALARRDLGMIRFLLRHGARAARVNLVSLLPARIPATAAAETMDYAVAAAAPAAPVGPYPGYEPPRRSFPAGSPADVAELLLRHGANPNDQDCFLHSGIIHAVGVQFDCATPLTRALDDTDAALATDLLAHGADANGGQFGLYTRGVWSVPLFPRGELLPLVHAILTGDPALVRLLLGHGAKVAGAEAVAAPAPYAAAAYAGNRTIIAQLLAHGADPLKMAVGALMTKPSSLSLFPAAALRTAERERARVCRLGQANAAYCSTVRDHLRAALAAPPL